MPKTIKTDLCIIGAGSGGLSVAAGAAQLGKKVVLFEKSEMGGDCLNFGCVPSKALLAAAKHAAMARDGIYFGVRTGEPDINFASVMDHVHGVIEKIAPHDSQERFEGLGVKVIREKATFISPREVKGNEVTVRAKRFIIATGSSPFVPPIDGLADSGFFTNETIFHNRTRPEHLLIIGGGPIGVEMAQAHRRLGARVTVIEAGSILSRDDADAIDVVRERLVEEGVELIEGVSVEGITRTPASIIANLSDGDSIRGSHLLIAVGRRANVRGLGLEDAGIDFSHKGIVTNARLRTTNKRVYAIGDVAGGPQFTHMAGDHASTIIRNLLFKVPAKRNDAFIPHVTYADPELAAVGLSEEEARAKHDDIKVVRFDYKDNDRARAELRTEGFIKVIAQENGKILGVVIVGPNAGDIIHPWVMAIARGDKILSFTNYIAPYPTLGEISKRVASAWYTPTLFSDRTRSLVKFLSLFD